MFKPKILLTSKDTCLDRTDLKILGLSFLAGILAGCTLLEFDQSPTYQPAFEVFFPELIDKKIVQNFSVFTEASAQVLNFDPKISVSPLGLQTLLSYYQTEITGNAFSYEDKDGNKINFVAENRTHQNQLICVVPNTPDFPRPSWRISDEVQAQTRTFTNMKQSQTFIRIPRQPDNSPNIDMATDGFAVECAQMTIDPITESPITINLPEVINNRLGLTVKARIYYGNDYATASKWLQESTRVFGGQKTFILPEYYYNRIPTLPLVTTN